MYLVVNLLTIICQTNSRIARQKTNQPDRQTTNQAANIAIVNISLIMIFQCSQLNLIDHHHHHISTSDEFCQRHNTKEEDQSIHGCSTVITSLLLLVADETLRFKWRENCSRCCREKQLKHTFLREYTDSERKRERGKEGKNAISLVHLE